MSKFGIQSASELKDWLESQDEALGELVLNGDIKIGMEAWREKAVKNSFFLGLDTRWLNSKWLLGYKKRVRERCGAVRSALI
jgi:hypothetical protein